MVLALVYASQRLDTGDELDSLDAQLQVLSLALKREEPVGRCLDFLMQEFKRKANTVSSKPSAARTTELTVDMKVQMRKRKQNQNRE